MRFLPGVAPSVGVSNASANLRYPVKGQICVAKCCGICFVGPPPTRGLAACRALRTAARASARSRRRSGVSVSTVSRALGDLPGISDELRQRVVRTAPGSGLWPPAAASRSAAGRATSMPPGAVSRCSWRSTPFPSDAAGFYHEILKGAEDELRGRAPTSTWSSSRTPPARPTMSPATAGSIPAAALLLVALDHPGLIAAGARRRQPGRHRQRLGPLDAGRRHRAGQRPRRPAAPPGISSISAIAAS